MSDNTVLNVGSGGDTIASDDLGAFGKVQRVKLVPGDDGFQQGDVSSGNPLPVDIGARVMALLQAIANPMWEEVTSGRMRVVLDPAGGAQTLGTVTTVGTVTSVTTVGTVSNITAGTITTVSTLTNMAQIGGVVANTLVLDFMHDCAAGIIRRAVTA